METFRGIDVSEAVSVRVQSYYLDGEAKEVSIEQTTPGTSGVADPLADTWLHGIHALITRFLRDDVIQQVYDAVSHAQQRKREDEVAFATRLAKARRNSCHVFLKREVANYYIRGLSR